MKCSFKNVDGEKIWIPGCYGGTFSGKGGCTCYKPILKPKTDGKEGLERELIMLRKINENLNRENKKMREEVMELRRQGLPISIKRKIESSKVDLYIFLSKLLEK